MEKLFSRVQDFVDDKHKMTPEGVDWPLNYTPLKPTIIIGDADEVEEEVPTSVIKKRRISKSRLQSLEKTSVDRLARYNAMETEKQTSPDPIDANH